MARLEEGYYWLSGHLEAPGLPIVVQFQDGDWVFFEHAERYVPPEHGYRILSGRLTPPPGSLIMAAEPEYTTLFAIEISTSDDWNENLSVWIHCCYADEAMAVTHMARLNEIREARLKGKGYEHGQEPYYRIQQVIMRSALPTSKAAKAWL